MGVKVGKIKQDINFLEYPLWFPDVRHDGKGFVWKDMEGYEYRTGYTPPDKVDILILLYLLHKSQKSDYQQKIVCTKYEILKNCDLSINTFYYSRLKDSLKRWSNVTISFEGTFYDGGHYESIDFHIMSKKIDEINNQIVITLDSDWLQRIKSSKYFKNINFERYKALKRPLSRRLFEWLCKSFIGREQSYIKLTNLGKKLALHGRDTKKRGKIIYASDVLTAIKPAINEINKLASDIELAQKAGISAKDLFTITYEIRGEKQDRIIVFYFHPVITNKPRNQKQTTADSSLDSLFTLLKRHSKKLEKVVREYTKEHGTEYVRWNILYSNKTAKKNYSSYLQKALAENWAEEWAIEEKQRIEQEDKRQQEYEIKQQQKRQEEEQQKIAERQKPLFKEALAKIKPEIKSKLWDQAYKEVPIDNMTRPMLLKIRFAELVLEYLNDNGEAFIKKVINDFALVGSFELPE